MKRLVKDYLASLKEREELDAVLPDLLSELGFTIFSRPQRGTGQRGVDIGAVGKDEDGEQKVFLFSVKAGDLTRQDWDGTSQALRSSLNEIRDAYIKNRLPTRYRGLKVVICLAFGGSVQEQVREQLKGYIEDNTTERISFDEWNGDKIAGLILTGILREELLPKAFRRDFQKAIAMVDEPDASYEHFLALTRALRTDGIANNRQRVTTARRLNLCLWILFVWCRDAGNVEAAYRSSEIALLSAWDLYRPLVGKRSKEAREISAVVLSLIHLHITIAASLLGEKIFPHVEVLHGLSMAVGSQDAVDVNLALFEILGRIGLAALWMKWDADQSDDDAMRAATAAIDLYVGNALRMVESNPALLLPVTDRQSTDIALFLCAWMYATSGRAEVIAWLRQMTGRLNVTVRARTMYPITSTDYRDLVERPLPRSDDLFKDLTAGSTLIPLLACWLHALNCEKEVHALAALAKADLEHCTFQLWVPDATSESTLYSGDGEGGRSLCDLPVSEGGNVLLDTIATTDLVHNGLGSLSAVSEGFWPILMVACRHYRLPVPPGMWIAALKSDRSQQGEALP